MSALIRLLRRIPLGQRIYLTLAIYVVAVAALVVVGWRIFDLINGHRDALVKVRWEATAVAALTEEVAGLHGMVREALSIADRGSVDSALVQRDKVRAAIAVLPKPSDEVRAAAGRLEAATAAHMADFDGMLALNKDLERTYRDITGWTSQMLGLFGILDRLATSGALPSAAGPLLRAANQGFLKGLINGNAFYLTQEAQKADLAESGFQTVADTAGSLAAMATDPFQTGIIASLDERAQEMVSKVRTLDRQFAERKQVERSTLAASRRTMLAEVTTLETLALKRESALQTALGDQARNVLLLSALLALGVMVAGVLANGLVVASIRTPILRLNTIMQDLAAGHWDRDVDGTGTRDEVGAMARTLQVFKETALRAQRLETEKREALAAEKAETERALARLDQAHGEITALNARLSTENVRLGAELDVSRRLQTMLLPREEELADLHGLEAAAFMEPAHEVGGDYYDILRGEDGVRIGIGDVTGHGLESGVVMLMTQSVLRTLTISEEEDLTTILDVLNRTLFTNIQRMGSDKNLTFALIDYLPTPTGGGLRVIGQHESLIVVRADGSVEEIDTSLLGLPVGLVDDLKSYLAETEVALHAGDVVVLYTDGITEAADPQGTLFGLERLKALAAEHHENSPHAIKDAILRAVGDHIAGGTVFDDLTLIVLKQRPRPVPSNDAAATPVAEPATA